MVDTTSPSTLADSKLFPPTKLDRVIILCLDRLVVIDDGPKVDMSVAQDIMPKGVREWWAVSLGLKAADGIFWVEVIHSLEHLSLALCAEIRVPSPRGLSPSCTPVPGIV